MMSTDSSDTEQERVARLLSQYRRRRHTPDGDIDEWVVDEIRRLTTVLSLDEGTSTVAETLYHAVTQRHLISQPGYTVASVAAAAVYAASRHEHKPRSLGEIESVSITDRTAIHRAYRKLRDDVGLVINPVDPQEYLERIVEKLDLSDATRQTSVAILDEAYESGLHSGRNPSALAGAAVYAAVTLTNDDYTQSEVSVVASVSRAAIRDRYPELLANYEE